MVRNDEVTTTVSTNIAAARVTKPARRASSAAVAVTATRPRRGNNRRATDSMASSARAEPSRRVATADSARVWLCSAMTCFSSGLSATRAIAIS